MFCHKITRVYFVSMFRSERNSTKQALYCSFLLTMILCIVLSKAKQSKSYTRKFDQEIKKEQCRKRKFNLQLVIQILQVQLTPTDFYSENNSSNIVYRGCTSNRNWYQIKEYFFNTQIYLRESIIHFISILLTWNST